MPVGEHGDERLGDGFATRGGAGAIRHSIAQHSDVEGDARRWYPLSYSGAGVLFSLLKGRQLRVAAGVPCTIPFLDTF